MIGIGKSIQKIYQRMKQEGIFGMKIEPTLKFM